MFSALKILVLLLSFFLAVPISYVNYRTYDKARYVEISGTQINKNLLQQLFFLEREMHDGAAERMQHSYPEGFVFMNALYGLSWCAVAKELPHSSKMYKRAISEANYALSSMQNNAATAQFRTAGGLSKGAFYTSWNMYLTAHLLEATAPDFRDSARIKEFQQLCQEVKKALEQHESPFLESYPGATWPADIFPAVASLKLHGKLFGPDYDETVATWLLKCDERRDERGLIPHSLSLDGFPRESSMGSSQSLILNFMHEIDSCYGATMFKEYRQHFLAKRFGLPGVREYAKGIKGQQHIDSGPVVWGIGGAASIVGIRTFYLYGEQGTAKAIRNSVNAFALVRERKEERYYLFGKWPMADAFMAWSNSLEVVPNKEMKSQKRWRASFQLNSILVLGALALWNRKLWFRSHGRIQTIPKS